MAYASTERRLANAEVTSVVASWSGGKDSTLMLEALRADPSVRVASLVTTVTAGYDRVSIHGVRRAILERQAELLGIPLEVAEIPMRSSNQEYEHAFESALEQLRWRHPGLDTVAFGDLFLTEVREYRQTLLARLGWRGLYPLWGLDTAKLAHEFVARGHRAILTCVDTMQIDASFAGRAYDASLLGDLPASVDPCGEKGEFHTCLVGGPLLGSMIPVRVGERLLREERFQYADLVPE